MMLSARQIKIFQWLRMVMLGLMAICGTIAGFNFAFLPAVTPQVGGALAAVFGVIATWAGSVLPGQEDGSHSLDQKEERKGEKK